ncbi:FecCD family ABC transporter permease [Polycladidibacter stylochi]|uniref:FecCD family ABC transporter permease n=1 Tax=Polycladidibacter stylochi TaxID=1807766 RepID=UPI00082A5D1E|nr:iron ABC transporter permease [Pseudovibrio stylochi]
MSALISSSLQQRSVIYLILLSALVLSCIWGLKIGAIAISPQVLANTLFNLDGPQQKYILLTSRAPRIVLALLTGGALAIAGSLIQAVIRNPLASPKVVGINSGAAFATCLMIALFPTMTLTNIPVVATLGGALAATIVLLGAHWRGLSPVRLALVGVAVGMLFDSGVDFYLVANTSPEKAAPMMWLTGSLWSRTWSHVEAVWLPIVLLSGLAFSLSYQLDILRLGDETAIGLGQRPALMRFIALLTATVLASISVGVVGVLGFVGLMAPHMATRLVGGQTRHMLPCAMLVGMLLVVLADCVGRALAPPIEVSAGVLTALFGAPFFIVLMLKSDRETTG